MVAHFNFHQFNPFFVGFDRMWNELETLHNRPATKNYPPYNIVKSDNDNQYMIEMAVAGFSEDDLEVTLKENELSIIGRTPKADTLEDTTTGVLHGGLAKRNFKSRFTIDRQIEVTSVDLANGMLVIKLERVIPEEEKPRTLKINGPIENPQVLNG
jgi:molecular chaperone IbpA